MKFLKSRLVTKKFLRHCRGNDRLFARSFVAVSRLPSLRSGMTVAFLRTRQISSSSTVVSNIFSRRLRARVALCKKLLDEINHLERRVHALEAFFNS